MLADIYHIPNSEVSQVSWKGSGETYDLELSQLGGDLEQFIVVNPEEEIYVDWHNILKDTIKFEELNTQSCTVFRGGDIWFAKLFTKGWTPNNGYRFVDVDIDIPPVVWRTNPDFPVDVNFKKDPRRTFIPSIRNRYYKYVWNLDQEGLDEEVWALSCEPPKKAIINLCPMGSLKINFPKRLDVIFISYKELNAEENWQRVLEKAPWAKRVDGVKGIFNAHKEAANIAETDMFYVVDGDAYLVDDWNFDFQPGIFDRDCAYVWESINPVNDLVYGYAGVKLFPKSVLDNTKKWKTLDMFLGLMPKIKFADGVSCITKFNVDEFTTWRSAFREAVKLYIVNQMHLLHTWTRQGEDRPFGSFAISGAIAGIEYASIHRHDLKNLRKINDYTWLRQQFDRAYQK